MVAEAARLCEQRMLSLVTLELNRQLTVDEVRACREAYRLGQRWSTVLQMPEDILNTAMDSTRPEKTP